MARSQACSPAGWERRGLEHSPRETPQVCRHRARLAERHTICLSVKPHDFDHHPEPPTRRGTGEVLGNIDILLTCTNVINHGF
ncbi:hypothetical protein FsymDg_2842 [Candidatus Protofrankia datiscae]|uniref:Uncharacterized protein n=1 Tax=Candidatus Protofrankia datiscae TaxID=2716812 RepID=F8B5T5_9ACTN|nr:hypothetical protein FsymDg_2842 [Candidatus Protofrankia datiscae]